MAAGKKTIACFGATGGCVAAVLANALINGHHCTALARDPQKLKALLAGDHEVPTSIAEKQLTIYQGDVKDVAAVSEALVSPIDVSRLVDVVVSGVGAYPTFQWSLLQPFPLTDPTICETAIKTIFQAISQLEKGKPLLIAISTAQAPRRRGVPLSVYLPYLYLLSSPLADKRNMEKIILNDNNDHVQDFVLMRPPFLTESPSQGAHVVKVGWEWCVEENAREKAPGPRIGWSMGRKDLGAWVYEHVIVKGGWEGKAVTLTY